MYYNIKGEKVYYAAPSLHGNHILNIALLGETMPTPDYKALHRVDAEPGNTMYTFEYIAKGKLIITQGKQVYTASEGDVLILNNNASHYYYTDPQALVSKYFLVCNGVYIDKLMEAFSITDNTLIRHVNLSNEFLQLFTTAQNHPDRLLQSTAELILKILFALNPITSHSGQQVQASSYPLQLQITNYIESHIQEPLRLDQIATTFSVTPITLNRMFKEYYNTTPKQFILSAKVEVAKQLLSATTLPVNRISEYLSFGHQNNFSSAFAKITGLSPSQYRKQNPYIVYTPEDMEE